MFAKSTEFAVCVIAAALVFYPLIHTVWAHLFVQLFVYDFILSHLWLMHESDDPITRLFSIWVIATVKIEIKIRSCHEMHTKEIFFRLLSLLHAHRTLSPCVYCCLKWVKHPFLVGSSCEVIHKLIGFFVHWWKKSRSIYRFRVSFPIADSFGWLWKAAQHDCQIVNVFCSSQHSLWQ